MSELRVDDLGRGGYRIVQNPDAFCFGMDAVLLADFAVQTARPHRGAKLLDLGTGTGVIPTLMLARLHEEGITDVHFTGLELQEEMCALAQKSIEMNGLLEEFSLVQGDLRAVEKYFPRRGFDCVISNPPYFEAGSGYKSPNEAKLLARTEVACRLADVIAAAKYLLKDKGSFCMVHRPERMAEVLAALREAGLEPKMLRPVYAKADAEATHFMVCAVKGAGRELHLLPPLVVYDESGAYSPEILKIYGKD